MDFVLFKNGSTTDKYQLFDKTSCEKQPHFPLKSRIGAMVFRSHREDLIELFCVFLRRHKDALIYSASVFKCADARRPPIDSTSGLHSLLLTV